MSSNKEKRHLERLKKELDNQQKKLNADKKQYQRQLKELKAEKKKVNSQKRELDTKIRKFSSKHKGNKSQEVKFNTKHRAKSVPSTEIEMELRQELKELKSSTSTNKKHLDVANNEITVLQKRLRSYTTADMDSTNWKYEIHGLIQQENQHIHKNTINQRTETLLKVIDALHNKPSDAQLNEIIQDIDKNEKDEEWKKALNELRTLESDSSEFILCHELLNEMVLRERDLEDITQFDGNNMDNMYASIQQRHLKAMDKIQDIGQNTDKDLLKNITENNSKWLKDVKELMVLQRKNTDDIKANTLRIDDIDDDEKSKECDQKPANVELEDIFKEILLNETNEDIGFNDIIINMKSPIEKRMEEEEEEEIQKEKDKHDAILIIDAMESKYENQCIKYDEMYLKYLRLKDESELLAQYENEYTKLLQEYLRYTDKYKEQEIEYNKLQKTNDRTEKLQRMCQSEYEKILEELIKEKQREENLKSKYGELQSEYNDKCKEYSNVQMDMSGISAKWSRLNKEYNNILDENKRLMQESAGYKGMESELRNIDKKYKEISHQYTGLQEEHRTGQQQYLSKCRELEHSKKNMSVIGEKYNKLQEEYDHIRNENARMMQQITDYIQMEREYRNVQLQYNNKCKEYEDSKQDLNVMTEKHGELKEKYDLLMSQMDEVQNEYEKVMKQLIESKNKCAAEYGALQNKYKRIETENINVKRKYTTLKADDDENSNKLKQMTAKCQRLQGDYGALYNELTQTKASHKEKTKQLEELYQSEYATVFKEFSEYKEEQENEEMFASANNNTKQVEELKKQNKFMKQNQIQIQQIYEAEYEKLLKEFKQYKQSYQ